MNQLAIVENISAVTTFDQEKVNDYLKKLRDHETSIVGDISTEWGRKEIASRAFAIAKAKNDIDRAANKLKEEAAAKVKSVNAERNRIWDEMEAIQKDVRAPLTEWEQKEETRVNTLKAAIDKIVTAVNFEGQPTTDDIKAKINNEAKSALLKVASILDAEERAQAIIAAIAQGKIPHVKISY